MLITKFTHACVRIEDHGKVLVIDPGVWSEPAALIGADAVLITHEHVDHIDVLRLAGLSIPVYVPHGAEIEPYEIARRLDLRRVEPGERFDVSGFEVTAVGGRHALIYGGQPDCANLGYIVDDLLYHPGDSVHVPGVPVEVLCVPFQASWLKADEAIDFVKRVNPRRCFQIHDGQLNERGISALIGWLSETTDNGFQFLEPRESIEVP